MKKVQLVDIFNVLQTLSQNPKLPVKFCIAKNLKNLKDIVEKYNNDKEEEFKKAVKLDAEGNAFIKESLRDQFKEGHVAVPYAAFEYNSSEAEEQFLEKLQILNDQETDFKFETESLSRIIKISDKDGNYSDSVLKDVLEDPNNGLNSGQLTFLLEFLLTD